MYSISGDISLGNNDHLITINGKINSGIHMNNNDISYTNNLYANDITTKSIVVNGYVNSNIDMSKNEFIQADFHHLLNDFMKDLFKFLYFFFNSDI